MRDCIATLAILEMPFLPYHNVVYFFSQSTIDDANSWTILVGNLIFKDGRQFFIGL